MGCYYYRKIRIYTELLLQFVKITIKTNRELYYIGLINIINWFSVNWALYCSSSRTQSDPRPCSISLCQGNVVVQNFREMKFKEITKKVDDSVEETLTYMTFPDENWINIRINNAIKQLNREIRRRTRVVGAISDVNSVLFLVFERLQYIESSLWGDENLFEHEASRVNGSEREVKRLRCLKTEKFEMRVISFTQPAAILPFFGWKCLLLRCFRFIQ